MKMIAFFPLQNTYDTVLTLLLWQYGWHNGYGRKWKMWSLGHCHLLTCICFQWSWVTEPQLIAIVCQAQMTDVSDLYRWKKFFLFWLFFSGFGRAGLSEVTVFHLFILVWLCMCTCMCTYVHGAQISVSCFFPNHPLPYLWKQGPSLNLEFTSTAKLAG